MKQLNEQDVRRIIKEEFDKNYRGGNPQVPPHTHDGNNNLIVPFTTECGAGNKIIYTKGTNVNGVANYTSPDLLAITDTVLANDYYTPNGSTINNPVAHAINFTFPLPILFGTGFENGAAPVGTVIGYLTPGGVFSLLVSINADGAWKEILGSPAGTTTTVTTASLVGKTMTFTNGILTNFS